MASRLRVPRVNLANLRPAPGSQHNVSPYLSRENSPVNDSYSSKNVSEEVKALAMEELPDVARMDKNLVQVRE